MKSYQRKEQRDQKGIENVKEMLKKVERNDGKFVRVDCGHYKLSIQGGEFFYSYPKEDLNSILNYIEVEVAVFTKDGEWVKPQTSGNRVLRENSLWFEDLSCERVVAQNVLLDVVINLIYDLLEQDGWLSAVGVN